MSNRKQQESIQMLKKIPEAERTEAQARRLEKHRDFRRRSGRSLCILLFVMLAGMLAVCCFIPGLMSSKWTSDGGMKLTLKGNGPQFVSRLFYDFDTVEITEQDAAYAAAQTALEKETAVFSLYDLKLTKKGEPVVMNGLGRVTVTVPDSYKLQNIAVYEIVSDSEAIALATVVDEAAGTVTFETERTGLFAVTERAFRVTFEDVYGGRYGEQRLFFGESIALPEQPVRAGFEFNGWLLNGVAWPGEDTVVQSDMTILVDWTPIQYPVTYHLNGGSLEEGVPDVYDLCSNPVPFATPFYGAYSAHVAFLGWYEDSALTVPLRMEELFSEPRALELYAKWETVKIYHGISQTPDLRETEGVTKFILDWSEESKTDLTKHNRTSALGCADNGSVTVHNTVTEVILIGSASKTYGNMTLRLASFKDGQRITVRFEDFSFLTKNGAAISATRSTSQGEEAERASLDLHFKGRCSVSNLTASGTVLSATDLNVRLLGDGEVTFRTANGGYGATAVTAKQLTVEMGGAIAIHAGDGADGSNGYNADGKQEDGGDGSHGSSGGHGIQAESVQLLAGMITVWGGNGGNGGNGGKGDDGGIFDNNGNGGDGGDGGDGGCAIMADELTIGDSGVSVYLYGGDGGEGGNRGAGGSGHNLFEGGSSSGDVGSGGEGGLAVSGTVSGKASRITAKNGGDGKSGV